MPAAMRERESETASFWGRSAHWATDARTFLAVFGLLLYAVLRIAYSIFYNRFGLTPDDLGLGYVDLLVQSAVGTSVLLVVVLTCTWLLVALYVGLGAVYARGFRQALQTYRELVIGVRARFSSAESAPEHAAIEGRSDVSRGPARADPAGFGKVFRAGQDAHQAAPDANDAGPQVWLDTPAGERAQLWLGAVALAGGGLALANVISWAVVLIPLVIVTGSIGVATMLVGGFGVIRRGVSGAGKPHRARTARRWRGGLAAVTLATLGLAIAALLGQAEADATKVYEGHPSAFTIFGVRVTTWGAEEATVSWTSDKIGADLRRRLAGRCLMYLGQSGGTVFIYLPKEHEVFRIPTTVAAVRTRPRSCRP
jgi:hypothetical protein